MRIARIRPCVPWLSTVVVLTTALVAVAQVQRPPATKAPAPKAAAKKAEPAADRSREADEKAIRANVDAFAKAYNAHDAKAVAALFAPDGELVDDEGDVRQGRPEIEDVFASVFEASPQAKMTVDIKGIRFLAPGLAVEEGAANVVHDPATPGEAGSYCVIHVKQDGKWLMASARDLREESPSAADELKQIEWLVGDWVDESSDSVVSTSTRWAEDKNYLLSEFTIHVAGRPVITGSQRIGWDPLARLIRCWVFDSEGGFGTGVFAREDNRWVVKMTSVTRNGEPASATNTISQVDKDRMTWESRDRTLAGRPMPAIDKVMIVRKPPAPSGNPGTASTTDATKGVR
jgi:uncharacterized protein (TIGR02246 family)